MRQVTAAILINNGKVLIAKRGSSDKLANKWEFPGGKIESNETPEECLRREIKEEFQIDITVGQFLGESVYCYEQGVIQLLAFHSVWVTGEISPTVHDDYQWVFPHELINYDFLPADLPFVERIINRDIII